MSEPDGPFLSVRPSTEMRISELERERERGLTVVYGTSSAVGGASVVQSV